jgi:hypothetical protein
LIAREKGFKKMVARRIPVSKQKAFAKEPVSDEPSGLRKDAFVNYEKPKKAFTTQPLTIFYRTKKDSEIEFRRYYVGFVQFAYVRIEGNNYQAILTNGDDAVALKGVVFQKEEKLHQYLGSELMGQQK